MSASTEQTPNRQEPIGVVSELLGTVVTLEVLVGASVGAGQVVALIESMKLHHEVVAPAAGQGGRDRRRGGRHGAAGRPAVRARGR